MDFKPIFDRIVISIGLGAVIAFCGWVVGWVFVQAIALTGPLPFLAVVLGVAVVLALMDIVTEPRSA